MRRFFAKYQNGKLVRSVPKPYYYGQFGGDAMNIFDVRTRQSDVINVPDIMQTIEYDIHNPKSIELAENCQYIIQIISFEDGKIAEIIKIADGTEKDIDY